MPEKKHLLVNFRKEDNLDYVKVFETEDKVHERIRDEESVKTLGLWDEENIIQEESKINKINNNREIMA